MTDEPEKVTWGGIDIEVIRDERLPKGRYIIGSKEFIREYLGEWTGPYQCEHHVMNDPGERCPEEAVYEIIKLVAGATTEGGAKKICDRCLPTIVHRYTFHGYTSAVITKIRR